MPDDEKNPPINETDQYPSQSTESADEQIDDIPEKVKFFENKRNVAMVTIAGVALAAVFGAAAFGNRGGASSERQQTTTETTANPNQTTQAPTVESTPAATPETEVDTYVSVMEKYTTMDIETFEKLPRDERLQYAQYVVDKKVSDYDTYYGTADENAITPKPISTKNGGQEIVDSNLYNLQLSFMQDSLIDGEKAMSSVFYNVEKGHSVTDAYDKYKGTLADAPVGLEYTRKAEKTGSLMAGSDGVGGNKEQYKVVSYYDSTNSETSYARFIYYKFTSYDGSKKAVWLMDGQTTNSLTELYSLGTVH